jgi:hypothetical protein
LPQTIFEEWLADGKQLSRYLGIRVRKIFLRVFCNDGSGNLIVERACALIQLGTFNCRGLTVHCLPPMPLSTAISNNRRAFVDDHGLAFALRQQTVKLSPTDFAGSYHATGSPTDNWSTRTT